MRRSIPVAELMEILKSLPDPVKYDSDYYQVLARDNVPMIFFPGNRGQITNGPIKITFWKKRDQWELNRIEF